MSPSNLPIDIQIRLPKDKKWIKKELVRIGKDNGLPLSKLITMILNSWMKDKRGKKISLGV
jgi:hypothetical protein